jgi:mRNA-degrading endonuclease toxin of MazEF toxin-antitoxin module
MKATNEVRHFRIRILQSEITLDPGSTLMPGDRIALTHQLRALSTERLDSKRQGKLSIAALGALEAGIAYILDMP